MTEDSGQGPFSSEDTARALVRACAEAGIDSRDAVMLRLGENAIYRLSAVPVVARIARTTDYLPDVQTEVAAARWLEAVGFPAVRLAGPADQPLVVDGRPVTFWRVVSDRQEYGTIGELARLPRWLHAQEPPSSPVVPEPRP